MHADSAVISSTDMKIWGGKPRIGTTGSGGSVLRHVGIFLLAVTFVCCGFAPIPQESIDALGEGKSTAKIKSISSGFAFVNGKYVRPPYKIVRKGTGIWINDIQVTGQIVVWEKFLKTQPASNLETEGEAAEKDESAGVSEAATQPKQEEASEEKQASVEAEKKTEPEKKSDVDPSAEALADLFDDSVSTAKVDAEKAKAEAKQAEAAKKAAEAKAKAEAEAKKLAEEKAKAEAAAKLAEEKKAAADKVPTVKLKGKFIKNSEARDLLKRIDKMRAAYEKVLRNGGVILFENGYRPYMEGNETAAETLVKELFAMQRKHRDLDSFTSAASVFFAPAFINDLFRNRVDYRALEERLASIEEERKLSRLLQK